MPSVDTGIRNAQCIIVIVWVVRVHLGCRRSMLCQHLDLEGRCEPATSAATVQHAGGRFDSVIAAGAESWADPVRSLARDRRRAGG